jgi:hypothetical protein
MSLVNEQLPGSATGHPGIRPLALKPLVGRGTKVLPPTYCMKDDAQDTCMRSTSESSLKGMSR